MQPHHRRRHRFILGFLALGLLAGAAVTAGPAQAASGAGITFPDRAWNRKLPAATRFFVLTDWNSEAVLDKETGLVWERSPDNSVHTWSAERFACTALETGNRKGWRLPSIHELASLVDPANSGPALPTGHPFTSVQSAIYWSAASDAESPTRAWSLLSFSGNLSSDLKSNTFRAWCVRGGSNADAY